MPRDISSSSSEDETDSPATEQSGKQKEPDKKTTRYQCPADFVSFCHKPCSSTLTNSLKNSENELWLIKAPTSFNPECFSDIKVSLSGLQTLNVPTDGVEVNTGRDQQTFSILASSHCTSELRLLTSAKQSLDGVVFGPAFSGLLNVCESFGDSSANQAPQVIRAAAAPSIPPGLKQRFLPFGSKTPMLASVAQSVVDGAPFGQFIDDAGHEEEEGRKKKKKKKKEKRIKAEEEEMVMSMKEEPVAEIQDEAMMELPTQESDISEERRKKKRKKKDREREEAEPCVKVEQVTVKYEPIDTSCDNVEEGPGKKKKKKKKRCKSDDN